MSDLRQRNVSWQVAREDGRCISVDHANLAVLMDIRDELQRLNGIIGCPNFTAIPGILRRISANTAKPKPRPRKPSVRKP